MTTRRLPLFRPLLVAAGALLASACEQELMTGPRDAEVRASTDLVDWVEPGEARPFRLDGRGVFVDQVFAPDFGPPLFGKSTFAGRCSTPADYLVRFSVRANALHLGAVEAEMEHCGHIDFVAGTTADRDGLMTIHAPDGDELLVSYEGTSAAGHFEGTAAFTGGTGRFTDASGGGMFAGIADRSTGTLPLVQIEGAISYAASAAGD